MRAFEPPYQPLNQCMLYKPRTKERHKIDKAYFKAIDPKRHKLPVCVDAHMKSGVATHHRLLMNSRQDMDEVAAAVRKIVENVGELRAAPKKAK